MKSKFNKKSVPIVSGNIFDSKPVDKFLEIISSISSLDYYILLSVVLSYEIYVKNKSKFSSLKSTMNRCDNDEFQTETLLTILSAYV